MKHLQTSILALATGLALVLPACDDGGASLVATSRVDAANPGLPPPATPAPTKLFAPDPRPSTEMATPPPPTPVPTPSPDPSALAPSPTPAFSADPAGSGGASPVPDRYKKTGVATDLAISGPGYFVLATKPNPTTAADLLFTRNGHFTFKHDTAGTLSLWRLLHADYSFYVVGYMIPGGTAAGAPDETAAPGHAVLATTWAGQLTQALGLFIDAERNPDAPAAVVFDFSGRVKVQETAPRGPDGGPLQAYLAIAQVANPAKLVPQPGFTGVYKYDPAAGALSLGVAVSGDGRPVGNANLVLVATLEQEIGTAAANP